MTRRLRTDRCAACALPPPLCICAGLRPAEHRTPVRVVAHFKEVVRPSHSARLLPLLLTNAEVWVRGGLGDEGALRTPRGTLSLESLIPEDALLLFPEGEAEVVDAGRHGGRPLIVPDGSWPQVRRAVRREPALARLPRVTLPPGPPPLHRLRDHPDSTYLATFEAVTRALEVLEAPGTCAPLWAAWGAFAGAVLRAREGGV